MSYPTVSLALNGKGRVSPETRQRVLDMARELDYLPNAAARATVSGRFGVISLLLGTAAGRSTLSPGLLRGIQDELIAARMQLQVSMLPDDDLIATWGVPGCLRQAHSDGLLINYTHLIPSTLVEVIRGNRIPSVWINSRHDTDCVHPDDLAVGVTLTEYVLELGHKRIAYVDISHWWSEPSDSLHYSAVDRAAGYERAMRQAGLTPQFIRTRGDSLAEDRVRLLRTMLEAEDRPTAVIAYSGSNVAFVNIAAVSLGLEIPRDLSIATFEPKAMDTIGRIITTALSPEQQVGAEAMRMLMEKVRSPGTSLPPKTVAFDFEPGQTCAELKL